jgi:N-methylhydantoinase A
MFERLQALAAADLRNDGFPPEQIKIQRALDLRYAGQGYEITLPCDAEALRDGGLKGLRGRFDQQHQSMFGHMAPGQAVEVVSYRVRGLGLVPPVELPRFTPTGATLADALRETRRVRFDGRDVECPVYQRERLDVGLTLPGPAILDQFDCTTVIHAGQSARVDEWKNLIVAQEAQLQR